MKLLKLRITGMTYGPGETLLISFEPIDAPKPNYLAGQFLTLVFEVNGKELRRSYSLCSAPDLEEPLTIAIKRVENGEISRLLHHKTAIGDVLTALEPNGQFSYLPQEEIKRTVFLFAAGVGITPLFSILKTALIREKHTKVILAYSNRSAEASLFYEALQEWQLKYPDRLKISYLFSTAKNLMMARLNGQLIERIVAENQEFKKEDTLLYTCGPVDYMDVCRITLLNMGFHQTQIKKETFVLPEDEADEDDTTEKKVKDTNTYSVILHFKGEIKEIKVPYHQSILDAALAAGINLPYSCHAGICSTCTANCTKGSVRMDYNEVLMDNEIAAGRVLVCTGHPTENGTTLVW
ncbi:ferredoxin--NADP reductase [Pedobacter gandavensis]|uniref:2Fe-2S iron-sulfur cluster binding domain-containing protein n=1 Tax=Pedobacter gandavensis TaxID=2679963 RepID=A0ABR6EWS2_9SPHI|nr:ferredoxin--NADP reductase [Pedobacter gandavensis]MBB2149647.1 2Fe-2S iron-sulfur cluster binding domain-containing protein [Pedobacter gandavensis]